VRPGSFGVLSLFAFLLIASTAPIAQASDGGDEEPVRAQLQQAAPEDEGKDPGPFSVAREPRLPLDPSREALLLEADSDTDVTHYFLELEIIPEYAGSTVTAVRVEGLSSIDLEPTNDGLMSFTVDLHSSLTVNDVAGDVASWSRVGHTIEIQLDRAYDAGESVQVAVDYEGYPQTAGYGAFRWWVRGGNLVIATLSEPFYARHWWPCKDGLDDKATMQTHVTVPSSFVVLSNGLELGTEALAGGRTKYLWYEAHPLVPYLASLAIASYQRYELQYEFDLGGFPAAMPVPCYVYPDHWDFGAGEPLPPQKAGCDELPGMLETFSALFGQYPWVTEKYGVVETGGSGGLSASMEHQTLSSMWKIDNYSDIMAHELAHQWWGDEVTCQTWHDIWLNEGLASYSEALYREYRPGGSMGLYWSRMNARRPSNPDARVYRNRIDTTGAIFNTNAVYNKAAWVVHMLRHLLGDGAFFAALADYRAAFQHDSATTEEFAALISSSFGQDLTWFTEQWVMNPGSPDYDWNYEAESIDGRDYLKLAIWQEQDLDSYGLFTMPIDIRVTTASGSSTHSVWNDDWSEYYVIPIDGPAIDVEFDEDGGTSNRNWVLSHSRSLVATPLEPPPVLLEANISVSAGPAGEVTIVLGFSEDIGGLDAADLGLKRTVGRHYSPSPDTVSYEAESQTATITYSCLLPGRYTLVVFDDDIFANGKKLDGETDSEAWWDAVSLPSGDGQPGGSAVLSFAVSPARHPGHRRFLGGPDPDRPAPAGRRRAACGATSAGAALSFAPDPGPE
jgi:aminopeptidase N